MQYLHAEEAGAPVSAPEQIPARAISEWRQMFSANREGSSDIYRLEDQEGRIHRLTFEPWTGRDPDRTYLIVGFRRYNPSLYGAGKAHPIPPAGPYELQ